MSPYWDLKLKKQEGLFDTFHVRVGLELESFGSLKRLLAFPVMVGLK